MFWQITFTFFLVQSVLCKLSSPSTQWSDDTSHNPSLKLTWHVTFDYTHPSTSDLSLSNFALCGNGSPCLLLPRSPTKVLEEEREASRTAQVCALIAFDVSTFTLNKMCFLYNPIKIISSKDGLGKSPMTSVSLDDLDTITINFSRRRVLTYSGVAPTPTPPLTNAWHNDTWCSRTKSKRHHNSNTVQVQE